MTITLPVLFAQLHGSRLLIYIYRSWPPYLAVVPLSTTWGRGWQPAERPQHLLPYSELYVRHGPGTYSHVRVSVCLCMERHLEPQCVMLLIKQICYVMLCLSVDKFLRQRRQHRSATLQRTICTAWTRYIQPRPCVCLSVCLSLSVFIRVAFLFAVHGMTFGAAVCRASH